MRNSLFKASVYLLASLTILFAVSLANAGDSTSFNPTAITVKVDAISGVPIGGVIPWPSSTPPKDYLECNGQSFSATTYPKLQAVLGLTAVPNYQNEFLRGAGAGRAVGSTQGDAMRNITGDWTTPRHVDTNMGAGYAHGAYRISRNGGAITVGKYGGWQGGEKVSFDASRVVPTADENRPRNVAVMYIIRAK